MAGSEQQHVEDRAVEQPQDVDAEMPPPSQPDGMAKPGQSQLTGQRDRIVLGGPQRVVRHRLGHPQPLVLAGRGVATEVQPWMIAQDLDPGADDEHHQEQVEKVRPAHPGGNARGDPGRSWVPG